MQYTHLLITVLVVVQSSFQIGERQSIQLQKCSEELVEYYMKEQSSREYHVTIEESLVSVGNPANEDSVEYQGELWSVRKHAQSKSL